MKSPARHLLACGLSVLALTLLVPAAASAGDPPPLEPGDLIGSTGAVGGNVIDIDPMTGAGSVRFGVGFFGPVTEIELAADGTLFATTGGGTRSLITIDTVTGLETLVGQHDPGVIPGLEFVGDTLYGGYSSGGPGLGAGADLVTIDTGDATLTPIGPMGYDPVRGLAYDEATGTLYGVGDPVTPPQPPLGFGDELFTVDVATGATTPIGPTGYLILGGIELGPDGILYGGIANAGINDGPGADGDLVTLDTATGVATPVGPTGSPAISGLAFAPAAGASILEIPTLSQLGVLLLAGLLAAAGLFALRRG